MLKIKKQVLCPLVKEENTMVQTWKPKKLKKKRNRGRPTNFETQLEMAKISWAPVMEYLSLLDSQKYDAIEHIPISTEKPYHIDFGSHILSIARGGNKQTIQWISGKQIKKIHDDLIETFGGQMGMLDPTQLDGLIDRAKHSRVFGHDPLETVVHKAAFLMHSLLRYHQFADGQKRTGLSTAFIFLGLNGYTVWSRNVLEEVHYCIKTAQGEHEVDEIAQWLADRIFRTDLLDPLKLVKGIVGHDIKLQCSKCHSFISPTAFRIKCNRCGREYELKITNIVLTGDHVSYNIGLHKLEESELVVKGMISVDEPKK